jgi:hypothetical protein
VIPACCIVATRRSAICGSPAGAIVLVQAGCGVGGSMLPSSSAVTICRADPYPCIPLITRRFTRFRPRPFLTGLLPHLIPYLRPRVRRAILRPMRWHADELLRAQSIDRHSPTASPFRRLAKYGRSLSSMDARSVDEAIYKGPREPLQAHRNSPISHERRHR